MKRVLVVLNNKASGAGAPICDALNLLRDIGMDVDVRTPDDVEHQRFIIRAESLSVDAVVVGGGDGTVNAALKPVLEAGVPLGILPLGTANDLARTLGIPLDPHQACAVIASRCTRAIDVGWANDRPFVNAAGIGLNTRIARLLTPQHKRRLGPLSYPAAAIRSLRQPRRFRARIATREGTRWVSSVQLTVGNGVFYGGGTPLTRDAAIDDGRLDFYSVRPQSPARLLMAGLAVLRGRQAEFGDGVDVAAGTEFDITTVPRMRVALDGEPAFRTPVRFSVTPGVLRVFAPSPAASRSLTRDRFSRAPGENVDRQPTGWSIRTGRNHE